jgi:peptidoglycan/xylan/chitin deacetylase (PgdA/CDA1 family)
VTPALLPAAVAAATTGLFAHGAFYPNSPLFGRVISRSSLRSRDLYLTFDDGPSPGATERILEILDVHQIPAAFFLVGDQVARHPELARLIGSSPHEVGNHTMHHRKLHFKGPQYILQELLLADRLIAEVTRHSLQVFRAPHGFRNPFVSSAVHQLGYVTFGWTFGVWDSDRPGVEKIRLRTRAKLKPGAIILLHDGDGSDPNGDRSQTAQALPGIIADAHEAGYTFKCISELLPP